MPGARDDAAKETASKKRRPVLEDVYETISGHVIPVDENVYERDVSS